MQLKSKKKKKHEFLDTKQLTSYFSFPPPPVKMYSTCFVSRTACLYVHGFVNAFRWRLDSFDGNTVGWAVSTRRRTPSTLSCPGNARVGKLSFSRLLERINDQHRENTPEARPAAFPARSSALLPSAAARELRGGAGEGGEPPRFSPS